MVNKNILDNFYKDYVNIICGNNQYDSCEVPTIIYDFIQKYKLSKDDVLYVIENYNITMDYDTVLIDLYEEFDNDSIDENSSIIINELINLVLNNSLDKEKLIKLIDDRYEIKHR